MRLFWSVDEKCPRVKNIKHQIEECIGLTRGMFRVNPCQDGNVRLTVSQVMHAFICRFYDLVNSYLRGSNSLSRGGGEIQTSSLNGIQLVILADDFQSN